MELGFLSPLFDRRGPWASVYFDTATASEDAAARQELAARAAGEELKDLGADEKTCHAVHDALVALPRGPEPPGHAVFATHGEVVLVTELTRTPAGGGPLVSWQGLPRTGPLLELADSDPPCLIALIDRKGAGFELRDTTGTHGAGQVTGSDWPVHRTSSGDPSERHFQTAVENTWEQNAAVVADELRIRQERTGAELLVLAGDVRERHAVQEQLPSDLRAHTVMAEHGVRADAVPAGRDRPVRAGEGRRLLDEEVAQARAAFARARTDGSMEHFLAGRVPTEDGRLVAAEGVPALVEAAREHRIGSLLVRTDGADLRREVWVGEEPDQVAVRRSEMQYLGAADAAPARADDALLRSAAATGVEVLRLRQPAPAQYASDSAPDDIPDAPRGAPEGVPAGGLGALLRWPYLGATEGGGAGGGQHHATR